MQAFSLQAQNYPEPPEPEVQAQMQKQTLLLTQTLFPKQPPIQVQSQNHLHAITPTAATPISIPPVRRASQAQIDALPPSSPIPYSSSPLASSPPIPVNVVSSPARLDSDPAEVTDPNLPFTVPPGPYSSVKPELSYAALIGRAILASPQHKLRLKDIYDYISISFPFYKREGHSHGQKWMNAIRQNLTNTPQFYKEVHPDGTAKGSLWCISDRDLPCFADGGYSRHALQQQNPSSSSKPEKRKRKREDDSQKLEAKRVQLMATTAPSSFPNPYHFPYGYPNAQVQFPSGPPGSYYFDQQGMVVQNADMLFPPLPPSHPSAHLVNGTQPYEHVMDDVEDRDVLFPPLPAYSQTRLAREARMRDLAESQMPSSSQQSLSASDSDSSPPTAPPLSSASSSMSIPALTPNNSSSSPVGDDELEMELGYPEDDNVQIYVGESSTPEDVQTVQPSALASIDKGKGRASDTVSAAVLLSLFIQLIFFS